MMSAQAETWRVSTFEGVFETDLETLKQWISEGCVLPTDKVSKGSLNWIEAGRAPMLRAAFAGEAPAPQPSIQNEAAVAPSSLTDVPQQDEIVQPAVTPAHSATAAASTHVCLNHPQVASKYICKSCSNAFCDECPRYFGTSRIPLCPLCGELCTLTEKLQNRAAHLEFQSSGFGLADFGRAIVYPFQHKVALLFGAGLYGFLLLAGLRGFLLAYVIMIGCIVHVISQVAWGRLHRSFMPDFSAFSMWDDVAVPFGLGISVLVVSWGPTILLVVALLFGVFSLAAPSPLDLAQGPGGQSQAPIDQDKLGAVLDPNGDPKKQEAGARELEKLHPGYQISHEAEKSKQQLNDPTAELRLFMSFVQVSLPFVLLLLLSVGWGIFYGPMAMAVAGYTQGIGSVLNPLVGLDTIRRMGLTYFKAFGMVLVIQAVSWILAGIVAVITAPLALPFFGNLPATFINGSLTFYFNLVVACVLGLSLFKCAERLGIAVD
ncbi:MAG TPA: hypothetical protein VIF64_00120 [Pyrinomonadaceae bacterium]|jgi:hypothetical protein